MQSPFTFKKYGKSGIEVSELFPHVGECADDICCHPLDVHRHPEPRAVAADDEHRPHAGRAGRRMGSWLTYGLGTENKNLPGFVVLCPDVPTTVGPPLWNNAFLPAMHQGTFISDKVEKQTETAIVGKDFDPKKLISYIHNEKFTLDRAAARARPAGEAEPHAAGARAGARPAARSAIQSMEIAYRMQTEAPDVFDIRKESEATLKLYGPGSTARGCLMAVRLVERGVRMVQVYYAQRRSLGRARRHPGAPQERQGFRPAVRRGDQGSEVARAVQGHAGRLRIGVRPHAGDEIGGGAGGAQNGRDHNPFGFTMWLAGGGVKGGTVYGATDDFGFKAVEKPVHVHDLHATILHLLGHRSHEADLSLQRPRLPPDRRRPAT